MCLACVLAVHDDVPPPIRGGWHFSCCSLTIPGVGALRCCSRNSWLRHLAVRVTLPLVLPDGGPWVHHLTLRVPPAVVTRSCLGGPGHGTLRWTRTSKQAGKALRSGGHSHARVM